MVSRSTIPQENSSEFHPWVGTPWYQSQPVAHIPQICVEEDGADISPFCRQCQQCMQSKATSSVHTPVQSIVIPVKRFSHVHIDIVGPLPMAGGGFSHLFTMVDRSTRWPEAVPLRGVTNADCMEAFFSGWVGHFAVPSMVISDRGVQFTLAVWQAMFSQLGIQHKLTTTYYPQANGMVERFHHQLKASLRACLTDQHWL
jgi:hypothetical protein